MNYSFLNLMNYSFFLFYFDVFKNYIPLFFTKRKISGQNNKNFYSNLTLYEADQSTKTGVRTLGINAYASLWKSSEVSRSELRVCKSNGFCKHVNYVLHTKMVEFCKVPYVKLKKNRSPFYSQ